MGRPHPFFAYFLFRSITLSDLAKMIEEAKNFKSELRRRIFEELDKNNIKYTHKPESKWSSERFIVKDKTFVFKTETIEAWGFREWYLRGLDHCVNETLRYIARIVA